jgi:hypothetical protein
MKKTVRAGAFQRGGRGPKARSAKRPGPTRARVDTRPRAIFVLGMHRSGTSALTRLISLLGAELPTNVTPANFANEAGYFESNDLITIHDQLLKSAASDWQDWRAFNPDWYASPAALPFRERVLGVLRHDYSRSRLFVIKDPRVCRFFPFWRDVLEEFGAAPAVAIPVRNPLEVMASLRQRDGFPLAKAALMWLRHVIDAEWTSRDLPRAIVTYDALLSDWQGVIGSLSAGLGVSWPRRGAVTDFEIERSLVGQMRHHMVTTEALAARAEIVDWVKDAYAALIQLSVTPEHQASKARLDHVRAEFDKASAPFGVALVESERDIAQHQAETAQLRAHADTLERRVDALSDMETAAAKLTAELEFAGAALAAERRAAAEQAAQLAAVERDRAVAHADCAEAVDEARRSRAERDAFKETLGSVQTTLSAERQRAAEQTDQLAELARERERAEASRAAAAKEVHQLRAEVDSAGAAFAAERRGAAQQAKQLAAVERDRAVTQADCAEAVERARQLLTELNELKQALNQAETARSAERQHAAQQANELAECEAQIAQINSELSRTQELNSDLVARLKARTAWTARLASDVRALNLIVETSSASAAAKAAALQNELSVAMSRAVEMEKSYHRATSELLAIKRTPGWTLLSPIHRMTASATMRANRRLVARSGLFDRDWYVTNYPEIDAAALDPLLDYLQHGATEGRNPSPLFLSGWYLEQYPDVRATGMNPLVHFLRHGASEGRNPSPMFETEWYHARYPDVRTSSVNPLVHYVRHGVVEGRDPGPFFDTAWYLAEYPDVKALGFNPLAHYLQHGMAEGRRPNPAGRMPPSSHAQSNL